MEYEQLIRSVIIVNVFGVAAEFFGDKYYCFSERASSISTVGTAFRSGVDGMTF